MKNVADPLKYFLDIDNSIKKNGWMTQNVLGNSDNPSYQYTVGLQHTYAHPEFIILGLEGTVGHNLFRGFVEIIKSEQVLEVAKPYTDMLDGGYAVQLVKISPINFRSHLKFARSYNDLRGKKIDGMAPLIKGKKLKYLRAYQVVWPDFSGVYPWEENFDERYKHMQPLLKP